MARRAFSSAAGVSSAGKHVASSASAAAASSAAEAAELQRLVVEGQAGQAEQMARAAIKSIPQGSEEHIVALRRLSKILLAQGRMPDAESALREALGHQQALFEANPCRETFLSSVDLLAHLVTALRMAGINPADQSSLDALLDVVYTKGLKAGLQAKLQGKAFEDAVEDTTVYTFLAYVVGAYIDGEAFNKAKRVLSEHLLFDYPATAPSSVEGTYELRDLRLATGLNFLGMAMWHDHSACGGGGHANHHHHHDHSAAEKTWLAGVEYTKPFTRLLEDGKSVGQLDDTDLLFLQATSILLDNLSQAKMAAADVEGAVSYSEQVVLHLARSFPDLHHELVTAQAQLLKTLLEAQRMDDAEMLCEQMIKSFPKQDGRTPPAHLSAETLASIPATVTLDTARVLDDLSNVMFQFGNPEYAERFLVLSLIVLQARLRGQPIEGAEGLVQPAGDHPAIARAYNGLGLLQIQMKDFASAEANLKEGLRMRLAVGSPTAANLNLNPEAAASLPADGGLAEFYHNLGLAQLGMAAASNAAAVGGGSAVDPAVAELSAQAEANLLAAQAQYDVRYRDSTDPSKVNKAQPNYAGLMTQLAQLYKSRGDDEKALQFSQEALALKQQLFKPTSRELVSDLYLTAFLLSTRFGRHADAVPLYRQMVSIVSQPEGPRPPNPLNLGVSLHWMALALDKSGEAALAADAWRKALVQMEQCMGPRELLPVQRELLRVLKALDLDAAEAEALQGKIDANEEKIVQMQQREQEAKEKAAKEAQSNAGATFAEAS